MLLPPAWRRAAAVAGLVLATSLSAATSASAAAVKTMNVDAEVVYRDGQAPNDPGNCSAIVFVQWPHVENATAWRVIWTELGKEASRTVTPPFDDTYEWVATYTVPAGSHWIEVGKSWEDGPGTRDCKNYTDKHREMYAPKARVEVTVDNTEACDKAKAAYLKAGKAVKGARAASRRASSAKAKRRARATYRKARKAHEDARQAMQRIC